MDGVWTRGLGQPLLCTRDFSYCSFRARLGKMRRQAGGWGKCLFSLDLTVLVQIPAESLKSVLEPVPPC